MNRLCVRKVGLFSISVSQYSSKILKFYKIIECYLAYLKYHKNSLFATRKMVSQHDGKGDY
jgi:hypothetical protein